MILLITIRIYYNDQSMVIRETMLFHFSLCVRRVHDTFLDEPSSVGIHGPDIYINVV